MTRRPEWMLKADAPAIFVAIPLSHYCEKARWGLDRAGMRYQERAHAPLFSRLAGGTVPALIHGNRRLQESTDILMYADEFRGGNFLYPRDAVPRAEVESLVSRFDSELGTHARRWAYAHLLPDTKLLRALWSQRVPRHEAVLVPLIAPAARWLARRAYRITPESAQRSLDRVRGIFHEVESRLSDGRLFLVEERFTAADLTFAALAAPMVFPAESRAVQPALEQVPEEMRAVILQMRESEAGQFAMRLFAEERQPDFAVPVL
jgi:glutathione S-transferase